MGVRRRNGPVAVVSGLAKGHRYIVASVPAVAMVASNMAVIGRPRLAPPIPREDM